MDNKIDTSRVKQINLQLIRNFLLVCESATKQEIASSTSLSLATCTVLLDELICKNEVIELKHDASRGGRPARRVMLNADHCHILVVILTHEQCIKRIQWRIVNLKDEEISSGELVKDELNTSVLAEIIIEIITEDFKIKAVGFGVPGIILDGEMTICDIKELMGEDIIEFIETKIKLPTIFLNDMNSIAYGFYKKHGYSQNVSVTSMVWTKNDCGGAGSVVNGKMLDGCSNFAGEISYLPFGLTREAQKEAQLNKDKFLEMASQAICSIVAIINPKLIILTGELTTAHSCEQYLNECKRYLPKEHLPNLEITNNTINEYFGGIYHMVMEKLVYFEK